MLGILALILLILWGIGLAVHLFGGAINVLLVLAIVLGIGHFLRGRSAPTP